MPAAEEANRAIDAPPARDDELPQCVRQAPVSVSGAIPGFLLGIFLLEKSIGRQRVFFLARYDIIFECLFLFARVCQKEAAVFTFLQTYSRKLNALVSNLVPGSAGHRTCWARLQILALSGHGICAFVVEWVDFW